MTRATAIFAVAVAVEFTLASSPPFTAPRAHAQDRAGAAATANSTPNVRARAGAELACVEGAKADLTQWARLLGDARRQLEAPGATALVRDEAAHSIVVLEGRVRETADALLACVAPDAEAEAAEAADVATEAPRADVLAALAVHVRAGQPTVSAGRGRLDTTAVHRSLLPFGREVDVCYEALAGRHAIVNGVAELVMHVRADGSLGRAEVRGLAIGDAAFHRCVEQARLRIASPGRPTGGDVTLTIALHLGPEG